MATGEDRSSEYTEKSTQLKSKLSDSIRANKDKPLTGSARVYREGKMQSLDLSKKRDEIVKSGKPAAKKAAVKKTEAVEKPAAKKTAAKPAAKTTKKAATTKVSTKKTK
jgi:hypothetical protein